MKRDKEWLKQKLNTEKYYRETSELKAKTTYGELYDRGVRDGISVALEFIEQLDEPEVKQLDKKIKELDSYNDELIRDNNQLRNELDSQEVLSQEWIGEHKKGVFMDNKGRKKDFVWVDDLQKLLVPKQNKPVIPQFVADHIEKYKGRGLLLGTWLDFIDLDESERKTKEWVYSGNQEEKLKREYLLIDAIRYGYEVEKDPHYHVAFESDFNLLYVTHVDIYGENGKFNYNSEFDKSHALKFTDKSKAEHLADLLGAIVV